MDGAEIKSELFKLLRSHGAVLCGAGDMSRFYDDGLTIGIAVAVPVPARIVYDLRTAPTLEYKEAYSALNAQLNDIVTSGADYLRSLGYRAFANSTDTVSISDDFISSNPHKTYAVMAGLGWIGKSCLLVTKEYGSSIRISSLRTDAPLPHDEQILQSRCGGCSRCVDSCPGHALTGATWTAGMKREELFNAPLCYKTQLRRMEEATGISDDLCGMCFAVCPYTAARLKRESV